MAVHKTVRRPDYSDIDLDFIANPSTGDVVKKTSVDAIKRSLRNLLFTNFYERPFRHYIGSNVQKILFDNINIITAGFLHDAVVQVIRNFEPRVELLNDADDGVKVNVDNDRNGYSVTISFTIINSGLPVTISIFLERLR